ncbi:hypothetical protein PV08_08533 [Exophiala spinifera]|uniref:Xylanolytic transcriptional activator regulatory domain-containing protein n=1 Tax=Exophiala spinifera TaxID=91928 RepID=A0A0D2B3T9_9EURO|nr:uncharacterized protein PV08_08533 [Exophiala spinifera]KIW13345.1 hypothetical protein PV08_08533 [Exophiala spinifera]
MVLVWSAGQYGFCLVSRQLNHALALTLSRPHIRKRKRTPVVEADFQQPAAIPHRIAIDPGQTPESLPRLIGHYDRSKKQDDASGDPTPTSVSTHSPQREPQSSFLGRSSYITSTDLAVDEDDARQYQLPSSNGTPTFSELQSNMIQNASVISLPHQSLRQSLIQSFLDRGKPWMPIIDQDDIHQLEAQSSSSLLLMAVLVAGSKVSTAHNAREWGERCYFYAKALFTYGSWRNTLEAIISTVLLQWWNPSGPEHVSLDSSGIWLRIGVGLAHQIGLHREPDPNMPDFRLRRRLWWTILTRDNQISTSHGRPRAVSLEDSNVRPLRLSDFDNPDDQDASLFLAFVRIVSILGDITEHHRRGSMTEMNRLNIETALLQWINELPPALRLYDKTSRALNPYDFKARQLHIPYFVALVIFYRSESPGHMQPFSLGSLLSASFISGIFDEFLAWGDVMFLAPAYIFYLLVAGLTQISSHRDSTLSKNAEQEIHTVRTALDILKKRFPTALGAERIFENLLKKSRSLSPRPMRPQTVYKGLSPVQKELLSPFGPALCASWPIVFGKHVDGAPFDKLALPLSMAERRQQESRDAETQNCTEGQALVNGDVFVDFVENTNELGTVLGGMPISQLDDGLGNLTFGGLDFWLPDWMGPNGI